MRGWKAWLGVIGACAALPLAAQTAPDAEQQKRLAEQKLKLVEVLVNSPAAQASSVGTDIESATLVERGKTLLKEAREALAAQRFGDAAQKLDDALRSLSKANSRNAGGLSDSAQKQRLRDMTEQVAAYRASLVDLGKDKQLGSAAQAVLQRVDALSDEGQKLAAAGRLGDANKKMAEAYRVAVDELSRLRAGQEVVMSLKFDTPYEEYTYEQKRFRSNEILVDMMIAEGRAEGDKRRHVDGFLQAAARLKEEAEGFARVHNYKEAVVIMEQAYAQLNRALQSMGVPAF